MNRSRATDLAIGALGMLLLIVLALVVLWWAVSTPAVDSADRTGPTSADDRQAASTDGPPADDPARGRSRDVEAVAHGVRSGEEGLVADSLEVQATVPFADVATDLGGDSVVRPAEDGQAAIVRTVEVLGRDATVVATGTVEVVGGLLVVEPTSIDLGGPDLLSRTVAAVVRRFVTIEHPIEGLPENLVLQDVTVQDDGFRADLSGRDVVLAGTVLP